MRIALELNHKFACAELGGDAQGIVHANRSQVGAWETWTVEPQDNGTLALKTVNSKYLCAEGSGGSEAHANRDGVGGWEKWLPSAPLVDGTNVAFKASDGTHFLGVGTDAEATVHARASLPFFFRITVVEADPVPPEPPIPPVSDLARLVGIDRATHRFRDDQSRLVKLKGADAFLLFKRFLDGADIDPVLDQLHELGYNLLRTMGSFESLGGFNPKAYPNYYPQIPVFMERCRVKGHFVLWTACAAIGKWMTEDEAIEHIKRTVAEGKQAINFLFSPVNEQGQHNNSINMAKFLSQVDLSGVLHDNGSYGMDEPCPKPLGHWAPLHIRRVWSAVVKDNCVVDHPNYGDVEVALDEPDRYGDEGNQNIRQCADAAGTAMTALFWVFHSMQGERAEVLHGNTLECAQAAISAMKGH